MSEEKRNSFQILNDINLKNKVKEKIGLSYLSWADAWAELKKYYPDVEVIEGTSTAGIAHAAMVAEILGLPMGYVRGGAKDHGRGNQIEGIVPEGKKVVVVEDLISTAGSSLEVVDVLKEAGANVLGIVSIFTYGLKKGVERLAAANCENHSLSNFETLVNVAAQEKYISESDIKKVLKFQSNPSDPSWMEA